MYKEQIFDFEALHDFFLQMRYVEIHRDDPGNKYESHVHPECEIYLNLSGDVSFVVENRIYPILPGSMIITRPYEYHHCVYHTNAPHKHFWILFSAKGNEHLFPRFFDRQPGEENMLILPPEGQAELISLCHRMIDPPNTQVDKLYQFLHLIHLMESADVVKHGNSTYPRDVELVLEWINGHFAEAISIGDLASASHVSINTLERHFAQVLHMSPTAYLKKKRLSHAAERLYAGESVMDACMNSGFSDYSNFIALFKRTYGVTPLKYQKQVSGKNIKSNPGSF